MLAEYYDADPTEVSEEQFRDYFVFLRLEKAYRPNSMNQAKVALRVFYREFRSERKESTNLSREPAPPG